MTSSAQDQNDTTIIKIDALRIVRDYMFAECVCRSESDRDQVISFLGASNIILQEVYDRRMDRFLRIRQRAAMGFKSRATTMIGRACYRLSGRTLMIITTQMCLMQQLQDEGNSLSALMRLCSFRSTQSRSPNVQVFWLLSFFPKRHFRCNHILYYIYI